MVAVVKLYLFDERKNLRGLQSTAYLNYFIRSKKNKTVYSVAQNVEDYRYVFTYF